jgi:hypothetical protein
MPNYVFAYHGGGRPATKEEGERAMAAWGKWFQDMGDKVVDPGHPVGKSWTVTSAGVADNGGANPLSGVSVVSADSIEKAIEMAKGCPILSAGNGSVEVAEALPM